MDVIVAKDATGAHATYVDSNHGARIQVIPPITRMRHLVPKVGQECTLIDAMWTGGYLCTQERTNSKFFEPACLGKELGDTSLIACPFH